MTLSMPTAAVATLLLALTACTSNSDGGTVNPPPPPPSQFLIVGADMSANLQNTYISLDGAPVAGLTVTVNGTALTDVGSGLYNGHLPATLPAGGAIQVQVTNGTLTASGSTTVPDAPATTAASSVNHGDPLVVTWTSATSPDSFEVSLYYTPVGGSSTGTNLWVAGNQRQASFPTTAIPAGATNFYIGLEALRMGTFTGAAAAHSSMHVRAESPSFPFTLP